MWEWLVIYHQSPHCFCDVRAACGGDAYIFYCDFPGDGQDKAQVGINQSPPKGSAPDRAAAPRADRRGHAGAGAGRSFIEAADGAGVRRFAILD